MINLLRCIKSDIHCIPKGVKLVAFVIFLRMFFWGFVDPFYSIFVNTFSENYTSVGLLVSIVSVVSLMTMIPLMRLTDKVRDANIMTDGEILYFFTILCYTLAGFTRNIYILIFAFILNGISHTLVTVGAEAYIRRHSSDKIASRSFGYYILLNYLGWIIGMFLASFAVYYYSLNTMFLLVIPSIILSLFIFPKIHERGFKSIFRGIRKYFHRSEDFLSIVRDLKIVDGRMFFFLILAFFDGIIITFSYIFVPLFALSLDLQLHEIALLMVFTYAPFVFTFFFSEAADHFKKMNVIAIGLFLGALAFIMLYFMVDQMWFVVLSAMISLSIAIIRPAYNGMITHFTPRHMMGEISSVNSFMMRLGRIAGPILSGLASDAFGIKFSFLTIAAIAFFLGFTTITLRGYEYLKK